MAGRLYGMGNTYPVAESMKIRKSYDHFPIARFGNSDSSADSSPAILFTLWSSSLSVVPQPQLASWPTDPKMAAWSCLRNFP
jgi:hypothetical protein